MRAILVPVAGRPESSVALDCAFDLALGLGADVVGCHVRPHRHMSKPTDVAGPMLHYEAVLTEGATRKKVESARKAAHRLFDQHAESHGFPLRRRPTVKSSGVAIWEEFVGSPGKAMAIVGPVSDLLVVTRPRTAKSNKAHAFLLAAVLHSSRPVLVLPSRKLKTPGRHIAIGWDQGSEAVQAVAAAMPLLEKAEKVTIISRGSEDAAGPKSRHLARYLTHWNIDAAIDHKERPCTPQAIESACDKAGADLLVMGAYTKGRLRERLFGGMTEHMLLKSKRSVFLLHS